MDTTLIPKLTISRQEFSLLSHRGFGEKAYPRYRDYNKLQSVANTLTGVEIGIEQGADTLEIDLCKTKDGKIVTAHGFPFSKQLQQTEKEYLHMYSEVFTLEELLDWLYHQNSKLSLYLELKSQITIQELTKYIEEYAQKTNNKEKTISKLYQQLMVYTHNLSRVKSLITEKQKLGLSTMQLRVWWVYLPLINKSVIDSVARIGTKECRVYGIEQGMMPWGTNLLTLLLNSPLALLPPLKRVKHYFEHISEMAKYVQGKSLRFIIGTINDPGWIRKLAKQGVNGIVPDNPHSFYLAGIALTKKEEKIQLYQENGKNYIPLTMKKRLQIP